MDEDFGGAVNRVDSTVFMQNCLVVGNSAYSGGGVYCQDSGITLRNCTLWNMNNSIPLQGTSAMTMVNCIGRDVPDGSSIQYGIAYSDVWRFIGPYPGPGNIDADPQFTSGIPGSHCLSQVAAGQAADSPCLDTGSDLAENISFQTPDGTVLYSQLTTRSDGVTDSGTLDMGYHYRVTAVSSTIDAAISCVPESGTLPFTTNLSLELANAYGGQSRRVAARLDLTLGNGTFYDRWRAGYTNVGPGAAYIRSFGVTLPSQQAMVGDNLFNLVAQDVTPTPYNLPPYPPEGDTDSALCTVTGAAP